MNRRPGETRKRHQNLAKQVTKTPLVVLAGLPHPTCAAVADLIEKNLSPSSRVIFVASSANDNELYRQKTVGMLLRAVSEYSIRQQRAEVVTPSQILLAYVPAGDEEQLLREFDFFAFPVRLTRLAEYNDFGRQYRHDLKTAGEYVVPSLETALRVFLEIKRRLSSPNFREPLFLPPRNFRVSAAVRMADIFREMRRAVRPWGSPISAVGTTTVTHEELRMHIPYGKQKEILSDSRGLLFPHDRTNHGVVRELNPNASDKERREFMQSSFRFGVPLTDGYHHDVQYPGRKLRNDVFECCNQGTIHLSSKYANVYPDDFVRASNE